MERHAVKHWFCPWHGNRDHKLTAVRVTYKRSNEPESKFRWGRRSPGPTSYWKPVSSWQLLGKRKKSFFSKDVVICRLLVLQWMAPHSSTYGWVALTRFNTLAKKRKIKGAHVEKIWKGIGRILEQNNVIYFIIYLFGIIKIKKKYRVSLVLMAWKKSTDKRDESCFINVLGNNMDGDKAKHRRQLLFNYLVMSLPLEHLCTYF